MTKDPKLPVTFDLPDGDSVQLIPWAFVVDKFEAILSPIIESMTMINKDLQEIDDKIVSWLPEEDR